MDLRRPLVVLVSGLFVLVLAFAVLSAASSFSAAIGDREGAVWLWRLAIACLLLLVIDGFLLLAILGLNALGGLDRDGRAPNGEDRSGDEPAENLRAELDREHN